MRKVPPPSKISIQKLDDIMINDVVGAERFSRKGKVNREAEASEVIRSRNRQRLDNYRDYRLFYKSLSPKQREALGKILEW